MAPQHRLDGDCLVEVFGKIRSKLSQLLERKLLQLASLIQTVADGVPDLLVRFAEMYALADQVSRRRHGIHVTGLRRSLHARKIEFDVPHESDRRLKTLRRRVCGIKYRLLRLLQGF